jgi:hypothetical protein
MSSPLGFPHIQGIINGKVTFDSAFNGILYSKDEEKINSKPISETQQKLLDQKEAILAKHSKGKTRIIPEKPKKKHIITAQQISRPFYEPVYLDKSVEPENVDPKFWNKKIWK